MNAADLIAFEAEVAEAFNAARIRAPVHLAGGNEQKLIDIFRNVRPQDWVAVSWRSHFHCLLKGVPREQLMADILAGRSITLNYPSHRIVSSAIVGGVLPIALGIAWSIKRAGKDERVWAFMGDMTHLSGMAYECRQYAIGFGLPITFIVEDNGLSVCSQTKSTWADPAAVDGDPRRIWYEYKLPWPHAGAGKRVEF